LASPWAYLLAYYSKTWNCKQVKLKIGLMQSNIIYDIFTYGVGFFVGFAEGFGVGRLYGCYVLVVRNGTI
jgi:hypothetical protein